MGRGSRDLTRWTGFRGCREENGTVAIQIQRSDISRWCMCASHDVAVYRTTGWREVAQAVAKVCYRTVSTTIDWRIMGALTACEVCGERPAARIKLKRGVGLVLVARTYTAEVYLCEGCAATVTSEFQKKTALQGWTSPRSAIANPFYMASNAINKARHKRELRDS